MTYLKQPNGPTEGQAWKFTGKQMQFLLWFYAVDENGRWLYHRAVRRLAKGSGKSPFAAVLALCELLGPVRFSHFDPKALGGVVGKRVTMPWVQIVATSEAQTENTMRVVRKLAGKGSKLHLAYNLDIGKQTIFVPPEGKLQVSTSSASTMEGAESTFVVGDETEHWIDSNGGPELYATVLDNLAKSGSRLVETCNAWRPGLGSVAEASYEAWVAQEEGRTRDKSKILYDARIAPADTDLANRDQLEAALRFVYADCHWADIDAMITRIYDPVASPDDSRRKYLNQPVSHDDAWCNWQDWAKNAKKTEFVKAGEQIAIGFDGSLSNDATALIGCRISDGFVFVIGVWEPLKGSKSKVNHNQVSNALARAFDLYDVVAFFGDVAYWESYIKVTWPEEYKNRVKVWSKNSEIDPQPFAYDMRGSQKEWIAHCELTRDQLAQGLVPHDDNEVLSRHVLQAMNHDTRWGVGLRKKTPNSPEKIDAAVAMILARLARSRYLAVADKKPTKRAGRLW